MSWSYRIVKTVVDGDTDYAIHEYYVVDNGKNDRHGWTANPVAAHGATLDEVRWALERMLEACDMEVIDGNAPA